MPENDAFVIVREKLDQATQILEEKDLDLWLTFVRETSQVRDPCLDLILGLELTWQSALLVSRTGERVAIVGRFDVENVERTGGYTEVIGYDASIREPLRDQIERFSPNELALNFSPNDPSADGLTHGMFMVLQGLLYGTSVASNLVSAENVIAALRGRKSPAEIALVRAAIEETEQIFAEAREWIEPGKTEKEVAHFFHEKARERGFGTAWERDFCPVVCAGPDGSVGHAMPSDNKVKRGALVQIDFGVEREGFVADLQRTMYVCQPGESELPQPIADAWKAARAALEAGREALRPGARGWEVDAAARSTLVEAGYPEYMHATGHHIGRSAHDGATVLGPKWERYGTSVEGVIEEGNLFAIELGVSVPGYGYLGLEEDVLVTATGAAYLSQVQEEIWLI